MINSNKRNNRKIKQIALLAAAVVLAGGVFTINASEASAHRRSFSDADRARFEAEKAVRAGSTTTTTKAPAAPAAGGSANVTPPTTALQVLADDCDKTKLTIHDGFQKAPACVKTQFGEVSAAAKNPSLLITDAPNTVRVGQAFEIKVSTRNLVRDRFLPAAAGGYYKESSLLNGAGLQRGHIHTSCRLLDSQGVAPIAEPVPAFFKATEDGKGGATPDTVTVAITGLPIAGIAQCSSWAGDGSHRIPMMERANQTPAFDSVRVRVAG